MIHNLTKIALIVLFFCACSEERNAYEQLNATLKAHGSDLLEQSDVQFVFRNHTYQVIRDHGEFTYSKTSIEEIPEVSYMLTNKDFEKYVIGGKRPMTDEEVKKQKAALNSVVYFAQLPYSLNGDAVIAENLGVMDLKDKTYQKIKVTFKQEGGGEDYEDVFMYWIDTETDLIDYLAYSYCEKDCGYRFRKSINRRTVKGIVIQDYVNYMPAKSTSPKIEKLDRLFLKGELEKLSEIKLEKVKIHLK